MQHATRTVKAVFPMPDETSPDEAELIARAKQGDREAQDQLCRLHLGGLHAWVQLKRSPVVADRESAMDLVQTVFRQALGDLSQFEFQGGQSFRNWLLGYADNNMRNRERFHRAERRSPDRETDFALSQFYGSLATPSRVLGAREQVEAFERAFWKLEPEEREIVLMARIEGLTHAQIAARLGTTEVASRKVLSRAMVRLASFMQE